MSRILMNGGYEFCTQTGPIFVLRYAEDQTQPSWVTSPAPKRGEVYTMIAPGDVFSVDNSIGGYFAMAVQYAGRPALAVHRVSGSEKRRSPEELRRKFRGQEGFILRPMLGLWATSSGSARRGLWHRYNPVADPIVMALREAQMPSNLLVEVAEINKEVSHGGNLCKHSTTAGNSSYFHETDGKEEVLDWGETVESHGNQYHIGCSSSPGRVRITSGTFLIEAVERKAMNSSDYPSIVAVSVTKSANRALVADKIREVMGIKKPVPTS